MRIGSSLLTQFDEVGDRKVSNFNIGISRVVMNRVNLG
jgi:hypothetical protein